MKKVTDLGEFDVIKCPTKEHAEKLMTVFKDAGVEYSHLRDDHWDCYESNTCYRPKESTYGTKLWYKAQKDENGKCLYTFHNVDDFISDEPSVNVNSSYDDYVRELRFSEKQMMENIAEYTKKEVDKLLSLRDKAELTEIKDRLSQLEADRPFKSEPVTTFGGDEVKTPGKLTVESILKLKGCDSTSMISSSIQPDLPKGIFDKSGALWKLLIIADYANGDWKWEKGEYYYIPFISITGNISHVLAKSDSYSPLKIKKEKWELFMSIEGVDELIRVYLG